MPRRHAPPATDPGPFAKMLLVARHKAHRNTSECARACELSPSFLNRIEAGLRTPELERCPAIANAYGIPADVLCWTWIVVWAPSAVPHLATSIDFEANPTMVEYLRSQCAEQQAVEEARKAENTARRAEQNLRAAEKRAQVDSDIVGGPSPEGPDFDHVGYRLVGPRAPQERDSHSTLAPRLEPDAVDEKPRRK